MSWNSIQLNFSDHPNMAGLAQSKQDEPNWLSYGLGVSTNIHRLYGCYLLRSLHLHFQWIFSWKDRWKHERNKNAPSEWISVNCGNLLANKRNIVTTTYRVPKQIALISWAKNYHRNLIFLMCPNMYYCKRLFHLWNVVISLHCQ